MTPHTSPDSATWFEDNRKNWDDRAAVHRASGYGIPELIDDPEAIPSTLAPDVDLRFPPERRGIHNEERDARVKEEVRPGVP